MVLEMGYDKISSMSIYDGCSLKNTYSQNYFAGRQLTDYLINIVKQQPNFEYLGRNQAETKEMVNTIKHKILKFKNISDPNIEKGFFFF